MNTKLTLHLDEHIIEQARLYAQSRQQSLSALVENYFRFLAGRERSLKSSDISPAVRELSGIIRLDEPDDSREKYTDYLMEKYQ